MEPILNVRNSMVFIAAAAIVAACGTSTQSPISATIGANPQLPQPEHALIPTVNVASASAWTADARPTPGSDLAVARFADGLEHPRWLYVLPNGDVLVAETNAPPKPDDGKGVKGFVMKMLMKKVGASQPSANRITLLRDADGDGIAERETFLEGLNQPFGSAARRRIVRNATAWWRSPTAGYWITAPGRRLATFRPAGHWTRSLLPAPMGAS
jgi:glucose/arabinose dehydrogenase